MTLRTSEEPVAPAPVRRRPRRRWIIGTLVLVVGAAAVVAVLVLREDDRFPDEWAADVKPFVEVVEEERDLEFEHPVYVEFLPPAKFEEQVTADEADLSDEDREELEQAAGMFRAVGLIEGEVDLFEATNALAGAGILAYYSYDDERIRIRGEKLTPAIEVTLVHELTHALQDQHFDLGRRVDELEKLDDSSSAAFDALVEGDARRIETAYVDDLDDDDRAAVTKEQEKESKKFRKRTSDLPAVLSTLVGAPYALGEAMLQMAVLDNGNESVDELFEKPPTTDEHLVDPWTLLGDRDDAAEVEPPTLDEGVEETDSGEFGSVGWLLVLAERIPLLQALDATDGWGGDAYVSFEYAGRTCVQIAYEGDSAADVKQLSAALERWIAALPDSRATVERAGDGLLFTSCDPGAAADVGTDSSDDALGLALTRTYAAIGLLSSGADKEPARCIADSLVHTYSTKELNNPEFGRDPEVQAELMELAGTCR
ncbi:MAG: hypothetical protein M3237_23945 [Actinomycetota bacterium]|nr:hypothetical protein [Actinomycetota bacterium]